MLPVSQNITATTKSVVANICFFHIKNIYIFFHTKNIQTRELEIESYTIRVTVLKVDGHYSAKQKHNDSIANLPVAFVHSLIFDEKR